MSMLVLMDSASNGLRQCIGKNLFQRDPRHSFVSVHGLHRERWQAHRDVFGSAFLWSGVAHPFSGVGHDGLTGANVERASLVLDS
jgi:hypothetical protein